MTALLLVSTALLIALNAFFVMGEYALVRSRRTRLEAMRDEGLRGAALLKQRRKKRDAHPVDQREIGVMTGLREGPIERVGVREPGDQTLECHSRKSTGLPRRPCSRSP